MRRRWLISAALCALLGAALCFVYRPMQFTGFLCFCLAAALLLWGVLERREGRAARLARRVFALLLALGLTVFSILEARIIAYGHAEERPVSAMVILGAGVNGTRPSLSLLTRLEAALTYLEGQEEIPIVVTGCQGPGEEISEARCMADWLIRQGVDPARILLEEQAENTKQNIAYSIGLLTENGVDTTDDIAVVTSDYHLYRASRYWGTPNMVPVAAKMPPAYALLNANYYVREAFGTAKLLLMG